MPSYNPIGQNTTTWRPPKNRTLLTNKIPSVRRLYPDDDWIFVQDSAPSHRSNSTQQFLTEKTPSFVPADAWPLHSPDLNPLDYHVWGELRERVYAGRTEPFALSYNWSVDILWLD